jgi:hypothetical protein
MEIPACSTYQVYINYRYIDKPILYLKQGWIRIGFTLNVPLLESPNIANMRWILIFFLIILIFTQSLNGFAESFRGLFVDTVSITGEVGFQKQIALSKEDIIAVALGDTTFMKGIQMELIIPEKAKRFSDSFAIAIYDQVQTEPKAGAVELQGKKLFFQVLPVINKVVVKIPIESSVYNSQNYSFGTYALQNSVSTVDFPLFVTIQPIAKGIPSSVFDSKFNITIAPDIERKGIVELSIKRPQGIENNQYDLLIDGMSIDKSQKSLILDAGMHTLSIRSTFYKDENTSFAIEPGKTTPVDIVLEYAKTTISIDAFKGADVYLDGEKLQPQMLTDIQVEEGEHTVLFKVGNKSISRKIDVKNGKKYSISVIFDVEIKED